MPMLDGTGPNGGGPMTGRRFGPCGYGYGRRIRGGFFSRPFFRRREISREEEKQILKEDLEAIKERLKELEAK